MDPRFIDPFQWAQLARVMRALVLCTGLALNAGLAFVLARAVGPRLWTAGSVVSRLRWLLYPLSLLSLLLAIVALTLALTIAVDVLEAIYPRFLI